MSKASFGSAFAVWIAMLWFICSTAGVASAQPAHAGELKQFLQMLVPDRAAQFIATFVDLNGDGIDEAIVYVIDRGWCGSGGCNTLLLVRHAGSWNLLTKITITRPPIRLLAEKSHGWRSIGVRVQGGGIEPGYEAALRFNGQTYPSNPSRPPAQRLNGNAEGEVLIRDLKGKQPLYP